MSEVRAHYPIHRTRVANPNNFFIGPESLSGQDITIGLYDMFIQSDYGQGRNFGGGGLCPLSMKTPFFQIRGKKRQCPNPLLNFVCTAKLNNIQY